MAEIKDGILGGVHGRVGTVVGFMWRGRYFIRSRPRKSYKEATESQMLQRSKLGVVSSFVSKFKDFVNAHYPAALLNDKMATGKEQLISMLMKEGIVNVDGEPCIDIASVLLSMGVLPPAVIKKINLLKTGRIKVLWDNSITNAITKNTDRLSIVAYSETLDMMCEMESIAKREDKYVHFDLPKEWKEGNMHFWSVWKSADGKLISTSAYHGIIELGKGQIADKEEQIVGNEGQIVGNEGQIVDNEEQIAGNEGYITGNEEQLAGNRKQDKSSKKKWAPPGYYARKNNMVKQDDSSKEESDVPRSILEAMSPKRE
ncbi:DUF6266 family protein [Myroides odoratimimus]|uniref:DUF6266 family protein n=1 Tax=Myroides odoratimimus TaxID=76832 RepID=UPI0031019CE8